VQAVFRNRECLRRRWITKPLLVTDRGLANMEIMTRTRLTCTGSVLGRAIFSDVDEARRKNAALVSKPTMRGGYDGVIAFGGGSVLVWVNWWQFLAGQTRPFMGL
jgi:4-hydroxybutyrate dehydrogenase